MGVSNYILLASAYMRTCGQSSPSPSHLPTNSLGLLVIAEYAREGAARILTQISALAGFEHMIDRQSSTLNNLQIRLRYAIKCLKQTTPNKTTTFVVNTTPQ